MGLGRPVDGGQRGSPPLVPRRASAAAHSVRVQAQCRFRRCAALVPTARRRQLHHLLAALPRVRLHGFSLSPAHPWGTLSVPPRRMPHHRRFNPRPSVLPNAFHSTCTWVLGRRSKLCPRRETHQQRRQQNAIDPENQSAPTSHIQRRPCHRTGVEHSIWCRRLYLRSASYAA